MEPRQASERDDGGEAEWRARIAAREPAVGKPMGTGTNDVIDRCLELGLRKPEFRQDEDFMVTLWRREGVASGNGDVNGDDRVNDSRNDSLSDSVNSTYQAIKANPGIQRKRISELTGKSIPTIDRHIALLAKSNLIEHRDSDKTGGYYVKK